MVAILEIRDLFERGALLGAGVGRQENARLVAQIDVDIDEVPFGEQPGDEVPDGIVAFAERGLAALRLVDARWICRQRPLPGWPRRWS